MSNMKFVFMLVFVILFTACSSNALNPLGNSFGKPNDEDPLGLGDNPKELGEKNKFAPSNGKDFSDKIPNEQPKIRDLTRNNFKPILGSGLNGNSSNKTREIDSDFVTIMNPGGTILNIRYTNPGNWIWGYTLLNSKGFKTRSWQLIELPRNIVMIKNDLTRTCLNAYRNGIVHYPCDPNNQSQLWELIPMSNQAVQIKNVATKKCVQSPIVDPLRQFDQISSVNMVECVKPGQMNLDQQWYITTPPFTAKPLYRKGDI